MFIFCMVMLIRRVVYSNKLRDGRNGECTVTKVVYRKRCEVERYNTPTYRGPCYRVSYNPVMSSKKIKRAGRHTASIPTAELAALEGCLMEEECKPKTIPCRISRNGGVVRYESCYPRSWIIVYDVLTAFTGLVSLFVFCFVCFIAW